MEMPMDGGGAGRIVQLAVGGRSGADGRAAAAPPLLLRIGEAARLLGLGRSTVYELIARDETFPVLHINRAVRIPYAALVAWTERRLQAEWRAA